MNNKRLLARLLRLGWRQAGHGYRYDYVEHEDGRQGEVPFAHATTKHWSTYLWARVKKDLRLQGEEIYGRQG